MQEPSSYIISRIGKNSRFFSLSLVGMSLKENGKLYKILSNHPT